MATGNTVVDGRTFTAQARRLSYVEAKDLIVLEGDGRTDAHLWRQLQIGGQRSHAVARKILYWRRDNRIEGNDIRFLDVSQVGAR